MAKLPFTKDYPYFEIGTVLNSYNLNNSSDNYLNDNSDKNTNNNNQNN